MRQTWDDFWELFQGMRKFLIMLIVFTIAVVFRCKDLVDGVQVVDLLKSITLAYLATNGVEHMTNAVQTHYAAKSTPTPVQVADKSEKTQAQAQKQEAESLEET